MFLPFAIHWCLFSIDGIFPSWDLSPNLEVSNAKEETPKEHFNSVSIGSKHHLNNHTPKDASI